MNKDDIDQIVELMSWNHNYLTDEERETYDRIVELDGDYKSIASDDLNVIKGFAPTLSEKQAKILNWKELDKDSVFPESVGHKNLEQIIGSSPSEFVDKMLFDFHSKYPNEGFYLREEKDGINMALSFMDFYVRFANNSVSDGELFERVDDLANRTELFLNNADVFDSLYGYKDKKLRDILAFLRDEGRMYKAIGLEKFINFSHFVEPSIIPHVFECKSSSGWLQSLIIHVLNTLANSDIMELSNEEEHEEKHKWVLERNSEHRRKILKPMKRKKVQEVTKRHIFRKNVSG